MGKYKGQVMTEIYKEDPEYFEWLIKQPWLKNPLHDKVLDMLAGNVAEEEEEEARSTPSPKKRATSPPRMTRGKHAKRQ